jgi:hypothetical protein
VTRDIDGGFLAAGGLAGVVPGGTNGGAPDAETTILEPGDLINTGTPQGVGLSGRFPYLADGDVVELEIDGLGRQRSVVRAAA